MTRRSDHPVTLTFDGGVTARMTCHEGPHALCRAVFTCGCETWPMLASEDGVPVHAREDLDGSYTDHCSGRFDPDYCSIAEWFNDGDGLDEMDGKLTVTVTPEPVDGGGYRYTLAGSTPD